MGRIPWPDTGEGEEMVWDVLQMANRKDEWGQPVRELSRRGKTFRV